MAVDDVYRLSLALDVDGTETSLGLRYRESVLCTDAVPANHLATAFSTAFFSLFKAVLSAEVKFISISTHREDPQWAIPGLLVYDEDSAVGDVAVPVLPPNIAVLFNLRCAGATARHNGKMYLPGLAEDALIQNRFDGGTYSGQLASIAAALPGTLTGASTGSWRPCVRQNFSLGVPVVPPAYNFVTAAAYRHTPSGQRRRTAKAQYLS